ncbi:serine--tRNA ligase [Oerskovia turbata]|uniref:Serine--tRNA ligase n=1 Tax=Oerskovia turbata TaxID=1713 RepID=A0A4V1N4U0_9CELL|nr:serine--tRNA ligase [Oerskovia turbata]RXR25770.1 serine--tRNA ligase [Oerskovia turbata]RXR33336.1 serine--tRNA ligase [Oerskovia turbata]TGJ96505.1 serine--tRNA ligase [Actinotalea fermentans ATCC 43279 = JCM 9966 = DSM 3133]
MIDLRLLRDNPDVVRASQVARGDDPALVDQALDADSRRRSALTDFEQMRAEQKSLGKKVAQAKGDEKTALLAHTKQLAEGVKARQKDADDAEAQLKTILYKISNVIEGAPPGGEDDYVVLREEGTVRDFAAEGFTPRDHLELGEGLRAIDTERGAKVSGARFYYLTGVGARLELALLNAAMDQATQAGFTPVITPTLVRPEIMQGTGFLGEHADEIYRLEADDLYLVGTSEVALAGYHSGEILDLSDGPKRYAGWSACYRREAGSYGKDTRGIIRVHQFHKVEMFSYVDPADAEAEHQRLLAWEEAMLRTCELPYRVIDTAAGDLGSSAARKFDCEAWLPTQERYLELTSTSNCTTFQARRLGVRERVDVDGKSETRTVATLNGTLGTTRWIVAILENHQQPDGSVRVPEGLRPYLGGLEVLEPVGASAGSSKGTSRGTE